MKSLEIVNERLKHPFEERILTELATNETIIREDELETIKQDLEVLEILRKHLVFMGEHKTSLKLINNGCGSKNCELHKVKQWLEEDE